MRIIISPAKKMRVDTDSLPVRDLPALLPYAEALAITLYQNLYTKNSTVVSPTVLYIVSVSAIYVKVLWF